MADKILIVEDDRTLLDGYRAQFGRLPAVRLVTAETLTDAIDVIEERHNQFLAVFVDGLFPRSVGEPPYPRTPESPCSGEIFVNNLRREGYAGPIFACSSEQKFNDRMLASGANEICQKIEIFGRVEKLLKASQ